MIINSPFGIQVAFNIYLSKFPDWSLMPYHGVLGWENHWWLTMGIINIELLWEYEE